MYPLNLFIFLLFYFFSLCSSHNIQTFFFYIDIEYILPKIISIWSSVDTTYLILIMFNIVICLLIDKIYQIQKKYMLLINAVTITYITYIEYYNQLQTKKIFFNSLLNHTMGSIHPPLILISIMLFRYMIISMKKKNVTFIFFLFTVSLITGSIWSSTLFGWNGLWMWDPVENISFFYWIFLLVYIHLKNKKQNFYFLFFFFVIDLYFFFIIRVDIIQTIHQFQFDHTNWKINYYPIINFMLYSITFICFHLFLYYNRTKIKQNQTNTLMIIYYIMPIIIFFVYPVEIFNFFSLKNISFFLNFYYSFIFLYFSFLWVLYLQKKNSFFLFLCIFFFFFIFYFCFFLFIFFFFFFFFKKKK